MKLSLFIFYGIIIIHDIPYDLAKRRDHPHQDAIHVAGWVSMFTLHAIWPFLWIWAMLYQPDRGWGFASASQKQEFLEGQVTQLQSQVNHLSERLYSLEKKC